MNDIDPQSLPRGVWLNLAIEEAGLWNVDKIKEEKDDIPKS